MMDGPAAYQPQPIRTNPFSRADGPPPPPSTHVSQAALPGSWTSAASSSVPSASSRTATFLSDTPQFSRKKARHIPADQQQRASSIVTIRRNNGAVSLSQYSASTAMPSSPSSSASSQLVGTTRRRQRQSGGVLFGRHGDIGGVDSPIGMSKFDAEQRSIKDAMLSPGQQSVVEAVRAGQSVFFTGCAGSGKSFLLSYLKHSLPSESKHPRRNV